MSTWLVIRTHDGERLATINKAIRWELVRAENSEGWFTLILSGDTDRRLFGLDRLIEFYRKPSGGREVLLGVGFMRYWEWFEDSTGVEYVRCGGPDQMGIINRRLVANKKETEWALKEGPADDVIKEYFNEQFLNTTDRFGDIYYSRSSAISPDHLQIAPDESKGKTRATEAGWRRVGETLKEIAEATAYDSANTDGVSIYFDLEYIAPAKFVFKTWANLRGVDRTVTAGIAPVVFSKESGNLANPLLRWDYTEERNMMYGGGQGQGIDRLIDPENDQVRHNLSVWNYMEGFKDAREETTLLGIATRALEEMQRKLPFVEFTGDLLDTARFRFGVDWFYGDKVTVRYKGFSFDGIVSSFRVAVDSADVETITASVEIKEALEGNPG